MRLARTLFVAAILVSCRGRERAQPAARDAGAAGPVVDARPPVELGFVTGTVWIGEEREHHVRPLRLDAKTGAWAAQGGGELHLFPTDLMRKGDLVAIATEGETEANHVEQLALVRGGAVAMFGPRGPAVRNPSASRDGAVMVVEASPDGHRELFRIDVDGRVTRLTSNPEGNVEPAVSPDGQLVAFTSSRDGQAEVYRMPAAGGDATRLTSFHKDDWSPQWTPDGKTLAFLSDREGPARVFTMAPDGTAQRRVTAEQAPEIQEDRPRWSPDGATLAFLRVNKAASALALVANGKVRVVTPDGFADADFAWGPDGAHLVVARHPVLPDGRLGEPAVVFVRVSDGAVAGTAAPATPLALRWIP